MRPERGQQTLDAWLATACPRSSLELPATTVSSEEDNGPVAPAVDSPLGDAPVPSPHPPLSASAASYAPDNAASEHEQEGRSGPDSNSGRVERLVPAEDEEGVAWCDIVFNPQLGRQDRAPASHPNDLLARFLRLLGAKVKFPRNPLLHGGVPGTLARALNGLVNGALLGGTLFPSSGSLGGVGLGGLLGLLLGLRVDCALRREEEREARRAQEVIARLAGDDHVSGSAQGGRDSMAFRVHRGGGHITAVARNGAGGRRAIRVRYTRLTDDDDNDSGYDDANERDEGSEVVSELTQLNSIRARLEQSLLALLVEMSYSSSVGPGPGDRLLLRPELAFHELTQQFNLEERGSRGASERVIQSYPVKKVLQENLAEGGSDHVDTADREAKLSTCRICLEDYKEGELIKWLGCPHHPHCFHQGCIDKWLRRTAECPICKSAVGMCQTPTPQHS